MDKLKHKLIKNFFDADELKVYQKYCYNKLDQNRDYELDKRSLSPSWYNDCLMNSLLDTKLSLVEQKSNLKLFPTYAYWRYYIYGARLKKHFDRPSCEVSTSVGLR